VIVFASEAAGEVGAALAREPGPDGVCVVLGGDGTMLRAIARHGPAWVYLGVNFGRLGFLMNDRAAIARGAGAPDDAPMHAEQIARVVRAGAWRATAFPRLSMEAVDGDGAQHTARALNDVYVERERGQTCHLRITVDGVEVVERMVCDGVIVATALGSTAYSVSAGGPAAHPLLHALHLTAICPHSPRLPPLVLPETSVVAVEVLDAERRPARAVVDGSQTGDVRRVVVRGGADSVRIAFLDGHDFVGTMVGKVLRGS
jgi:NAD+ kinase